jgi:hypothetical protein
MAVQSALAQEQARFDPMITGFNPADMYAADPHQRVLTTFPGVFTGIGEFTIHKEFVSSKVAGGGGDAQRPRASIASRFRGRSRAGGDPAQRRRPPHGRSRGASPVFLQQMKDVLKRHPKTTIIWAHTGVGAWCVPSRITSDMIESIVSDPAYNHVYSIISWDEVAKYVVSSPETTKRVADALNRYPDRFLFGSDTVAPSSPEKYYAVFDMYNPMWALLTPEASQKVRIGNYVRAVRRRPQARARVGKSERRSSGLLRRVSEIGAMWSGSPSLNPR